MSRRDERLWVLSTRKQYVCRRPTARAKRFEITLFHLPNRKSISFIGNILKKMHPYVHQTCTLTQRILFFVFYASYTLKLWNVLETVLIPSNSQIQTPRGCENVWLWTTTELVLDTFWKHFNRFNDECVGTVNSCKNVILSYYVRENIAELDSERIHQCGSFSLLNYAIKSPCYILGNVCEVFNLVSSKERFIMIANLGSYACLADNVTMAALSMAVLWRFWWWELLRFSYLVNVHRPLNQKHFQNEILQVYTRPKFEKT